MALILVFITEIEATKAGLGFLLWEAFQLMDTRHVFVGVVTFGLLGVATTWLLKWLERGTRPWIQRPNRPRARTRRNPQKPHMAQDLPRDLHHIQPRPPP